MSTTPNETQYAVKNLLNCYQYWSEQQSNPVLDLLDNKPLTINEKYPDPALKCHSDMLRVFYHYHEQPFQYADEHGHFHYFIKIEKTDCSENEWSHLAGLCINSLGQPIRWFTTNHWVTAARWINSEELIPKLDLIESDNHSESPLQQWLVSILVIFKKLIIELLIARDKKLTQLMGADEHLLKDLLKNRQHYILGEQVFDLHTYISSCHDLDCI